MKIKIVNSNHFICKVNFDKRLDPRIKYFWMSRYLDLVAADKAVIISHHGKIIGFLRYLIGKFSAFPAIFALGTYVLPEWRSRGLAQKMWSQAIKSVKPAFVNVYLTSRNARKMIISIEKNIPTLYFIKNILFINVVSMLFLFLTIIGRRNFRRLFCLCENRYDC